MKRCSICGKNIEKGETYFNGPFNRGPAKHKKCSNDLRFAKGDVLLGPIKETSIGFREQRDTLAAENARLREELADWHNAALHVESEHSDEVHCGCVPILQKHNTDLRTSLGWLVRACEQRIPWSQREKLDEEIQDARRILANREVSGSVRSTGSST